MRLFLITTLTILMCNCYAQTRAVKVFKKRQYIKAVLIAQTSGIIDVEDEPVDVYFLKRHFDLHYHLPEKLTDKQYSGQTITLWNDPKGKKDFERNWRYTYSYDSLGRVTNFTYSSCLICSSLPYNYIVTYDSKGQVVVIDPEHETNGQYKFYYNKKGDIIKFEEYSRDNVSMEITLSDKK